MKMEKNLDTEIPFGLTIKPTLKEMENFQSFVYNLALKYSNSEHGAIKIIPPKGFSLINQKLLSKQINKLIVKRPLRQSVSLVTQGHNNLFDTVLCQQKSLPINDYIKASKGKLFKKTKISMQEENLFWNNLNGSNGLYGADVPGSLIDKDNLSTWNLHNLNTLLM